VTETGIDSIATIVQPLVQRGLFESPEKAIRILTQDYVLRQIDRWRTVLSQMEAKHGMRYEQFDLYLARRSRLLTTNPTPQLGQSILSDEDDAFDWKVAYEMLQSWLGLQKEIGL
jgi:hypothetical protein